MSASIAMYANRQNGLLTWVRGRRSIEQM